MELLLKTKNEKEIKLALSSESQGYFRMLNKFKNTFDEYLQKYS